jgi:anti-sigma factor RsiW
MRCADVERLVDRYVDGQLPAAAAASLERHAQTCADCRQRIADARALGRLIAADAAAIRAPRGFANQVMDRIWQETLWKPAVAARDVAASRFASRGYRRLGFSVMLGAAVLIAGIALPRAVGLGAAGGGPAIVERMLSGADGAVKGALSAAGGSAAAIVEGGSR